MAVLMDERQTAEWLNCSHKTLQARRVKGGGPRFVKVRRLVRYSVEDLQEFVRQNTRENTVAVS